ncbi:hypothetical protein BGY98DRAFT_990649 [Russula aff. rugulosa BPL654]|nr:hypothetical protein BGY98DRAFT_990649 [Russula aff. rugulosa BPL654]
MTDLKFNDFNMDYVALQIFWHITNGIYVWEYVTTLDFELDIIQGRRPYQWTIWIYSLARSALLIAIILNLIDFDVTSSMDCQVFAYVSLVSASLLIVLRVIAIWDKNKFAVAIAVITWVINVLYLQFRGTRDRTLRTCVIPNSEEIKSILIIMVITNAILLVTMLVGLFRLRTDSSCAFGIGRFLWKQVGSAWFIWLLIATVAGIPPVVFIFLNLNGIVTLFSPVSMRDTRLNMFQLPSLIVTTIAATRIYRSLVDYTIESSNISLDAGFLKSDGKVSKTKRNDSAPISLEVVSPATAVHKKDLLTTAEAQTEERTLGQQPYTKIGRAGLGMTLSIATLV